MKSIKIRLEPNNKQVTLFSQHCGVARHAYNQGLSYCNDLFKEGVKTPSAIDLHKWLVAVVKKENPWYYNSSKCPPPFPYIRPTLSPASSISALCAPKLVSFHICRFRLYSASAACFPVTIIVQPENLLCQLLLLLQKPQIPYFP